MTALLQVPTAPHPNTTAADLWNPAACQALIDQLWRLRERLLRHESAQQAQIDRVDPAYRASARNLLHYLALRSTDLRPLQEQLAGLGISSLGQAESNVLANIDKVLGILHRLVGQDWTDHSADEPAGLHTGQRLLQTHAQAVLGAAPSQRSVRIMVTLPSEAATQPELVRQLVSSGLDIARINCAHDGPAEWKAMAANVRRAAKSLRRPVRVLMDLGGPKLRTGPLPAGTAVLKVRPQRDELGRVTAPALLGLRANGSTAAVPGVKQHVGVKADWLATLQLGDTIHLVDARDAERTLRVVALEETGVVVEADQTLYLVPRTRLTRHRQIRHAPANTRLTDIPSTESKLLLRMGDRLRVVSPAVEEGEPVVTFGSDNARLPTVACTLPEVFCQVQPGERIWFDDGRIGGRICAASPDGLEVEITQARETGERLASDKGINLPDSLLELPALTPKDLDDLATVVQLADMVGLSFVQQASDVEALHQRLDALGATDLGVVLKIETRRAFENLPELLLSAMAGPSCAVMIARGDLAVECGYERLAEIQEEILWATEAAHMPVIWATQVLETLAKTGLPSRAEITDAAMGERAECVMLNKGPHILDAMRTLDDILRRMQAHQTKKGALLRALAAWQEPA